MKGNFHFVVFNLKGGNWIAAKGHEFPFSVWRFTWQKINEGPVVIPLQKVHFKFLVAFVNNGKKVFDFKGELFEFYF